MSSRTPAAPTSGVFDGNLDMQSLPPPVQSPRFSDTKTAQMPGYLPDTQDTKEINDVREDDTSSVSPKIDSLSGNTQASPGHDPQEDAQPPPATSVIEDPDEDKVQSEPYHKLKAEWEDARNSQDDVEFDPKPPTETNNAWKTCLDHLVKRDKTACDSWSEDMDNILIFAGLFSAVVTAFVIDSYKWLEADPANTTNMALQHISSQLAGKQRLEYVPAPFIVTSTVRRINVCWFISLMSALTTAALALLCKQWIREHRQELPPWSYREEISLRQMRFDSLRYWKVGEIVAILPLLLQIALVFFFIGIVDLLWARDRALAVIMSVWCLFTVAVVIITTVLPVAVFLYHTDGNPEGYKAKRAKVVPCAFKSPQSWLFLRAVLLLQGFIHNIITLDFKSSAFSAIYNSVESWTSTDHPIIELTAGNPPLRDSSFHKYLLSGLAWIDKHISTNSIVPDLYHCLIHTGAAHHDASLFSGADSRVLTWPLTWRPDRVTEEKSESLRLYRHRKSEVLEKHDTLLQFFSRRLPHDRTKQFQAPLEQLIMRRIADTRYKSTENRETRKYVPPEAWDSSLVFMKMDLHADEYPECSPPFLCALTAHVIRLSFSFEVAPQVRGKTHLKYTDNLETIWICTLIYDSLQSQKIEHCKGAVTRYLMEEGILRTLEDVERDEFISRCEPKNEDILCGSFRGVVHLLEQMRLQLKIAASDSWKGLVSDLDLVEENSDTGDKP